MKENCIMQMRSSRVLKKLRAGQVASCVKLNLADPRAAEIAALCGVDCVWLDREHVASDLRDIENQIRAAKIHDVDTVVRVARGSYSSLIHPLEMDAAGIMVPHLMGLEDARKVAWQTRFYPLGRRAVDGGNADGAYCMVPPLDYMRQANRERFVIVQIEDPEPMKELDQIAQVVGIDMLFFGPSDFSQGIGDPNNFANPRVAEARRLIAETARRHGKFAGTVATCETIAETVALGYQFVSVGADVLALGELFRKVVQAFAEIGS
ncbi:MAG: aldolase [Pirellulales bacterium]|nr:aldolase [Pirellulales bacterium]